MFGSNGFVTTSEEVEDVNIGLYTIKLLEYINLKKSQKSNRTRNLILNCRNYVIRD